MATVKVVLRKKENKDGTFPLALRITKERKTSFIHLGYNLDQKDWDSLTQRVRKSHPNSTRLNNFISSKIAEASNKSLEAEASDERATANSIRKSIKPKSSALFFAQGDIYLEFLKGLGSYTAHETEKSRLGIFKEFLGNKDIAFPDITMNLLERFYLHLKSKRKLSDRTAMNYLRLVRVIYNRAMDDGLVDRKYYPFGKGKISIKLTRSTKVGSSKTDVEKLKNAVLTNPTHDHARNLWLLSFYFSGMRISDVLRLRWSNFYDGRLNYKMGKNQKPISLKVHANAQEILGKYEDQKTRLDDLVFPDLKELDDLSDAFEVKRRISFVVTNLDKIMRNHVLKIAGIDGKMSMHIARHTFSTLGVKKGVPAPIMQNLLGHSHLSTTEGYLGSFKDMTTDEIMDDIFD